MDPVLQHVDLVSTDVAALVAFYRRLGVDIPTGIVWPDEDAPQHVGIDLPNGMHLSLSGEEMTRSYAPSWRGPAEAGTILIFRVSSRDAVDERHAAMVGAGYASDVEPFDAFWGNRYAIVDDPAGNPVGMMSHGALRDAGNGYS